MRPHNYAPSRLSVRVPATHSRLRPLAPIWPPARAGTASTAGSTRTCASPLAARPTRRPPRRARPATPRTRLLSAPSRVCHLGSSREVEGGGNRAGRGEATTPAAPLPAPPRARTSAGCAGGARRRSDSRPSPRTWRPASHRRPVVVEESYSAIECQSQLASRTAQEAYTPPRTRTTRPLGGEAARFTAGERAGRREEGEGQVGRAECVAQRHVRVAAIPVLRPPLRRPPLLDEPRHVRRRREPAAQVSAHHRQGPDHEWKGAVHAPLLRAAVPPRVRRADLPRRPAAVPPLLCHERVVLEVASVHARQARRRPEEGGEPRDVDERVVVRLCVEGGARVGDRRVAEPREQLVDARVDAARLVEVGRVDDGKVVLPDAPPLFVELLHVARREAALAHDEANQRRGADLGCWHEHGLADPLARLWRTRIGHEAEDQKRGRRLLSRRVGRASPPPTLTVETVEHPAALAQ
mmetsp:Transcript_20673/g.62070  ORF Transcript_20673/g.62070 Transcript_20673/m.62070 type:complete len:467 (+) Transcript_20673:210-1610(+)